MKLVNIKIRGTTQAVQYSGSSTHAGALQHWVETGEYKQPHISTQDIRPTTLNMPDGSIIELEAGDYLCVHTLGSEIAFTGVTAEVFAKHFEVLPD